MSTTFNVAIIGAGGIANAHVGAIAGSKGRLALAGVVDPVAENRERLASAHSAQGFASTAELIKAVKAGSVSVDGAVVCTPPFARIEVIGSLLKAGIPVLSEKPLAHNSADSKKLATLARKHGKVFTAVGYCHRFTPAVLAMKQMALEGKIGRVVRFENFFACDLPGHQTKWFSDPKKAGGGAYIDMGSHSVDLFHFMVGPAKTVAALFDHKWPKRTETAATVLLKSAKANGKNMPAGLAGVIFSGWAETSRFTVSLVGTEGMLSYDYEKDGEIIFKDLLGKPTSMPIESCGVRFARQLEAFADAVQKKAKKTGLATFADGGAAADMVTKAAKLAAKG